jgi:hypothetical protein
MAAVDPHAKGGTMSNTATELRASSFARSTAHRVADGVVAGYVRALASASPEQTEPRETHPTRDRDCDQGRVSRSGAAAARRRSARRSAVLTA